MTAPKRKTTTPADRRAAEEARYIKALVDAAPPLTDEQVSRLGALLRPRPEDGA